MRHSVVVTFIATVGFIAGSTSARSAAGSAAPAAAAAAPIAVEKQNAFVKSHCTVCHTDRANNGGLSLEGFDGARVAPSLAAMMLSKITSGTALATVNAADHDAAAAATLARGLGKGAVNASGLGAPDKGTVDGLVTAFASQSAGAANWSVERTRQRATGAEMVTASIVRELPSAAEAGRPLDIEAAMYRLVLTCNVTAREGAMQLAWSPLPKEGPLAVAVDGKPATMFTVEGKERMGNGNPVTTGPAAYVFARFGGAADSRVALPARTLTASQLFAGESVTFPFDQLTTPAREALSTCFR
jgi:hypothetical protein